jgi:hypothetical protein
MNVAISLEDALARTWKSLLPKTPRSLSFAEGTNGITALRTVAAKAAMP